MSGEYVSQEVIKNALVDKFKSRIGASRIPTWNDAFDAVTNLPPAANVAEVRHGRWIDNKVSFYLGCSECGCYLEYAVDTFLDNGDHYHFCPNCGAKMDGKSADEAPAGPYDLLYEEGEPDA